MVNPFSFLNDAGNYEARAVSKQTVDGIVISTTMTSDEGLETAVPLESGSFHPIERYPDRTSAEVGHGRWVQRIREGQRRFTQLGWLEGLVEEKEFEL